MSSVWLAPHLGGALAERFACERDALAALDYPYIARLHGAGVDERGQPYIVLEAIADPPLTQWTYGSAADTRTRLAVVVQVLDAVEHAHADMVVHRGLKPANNLVDASACVELLDFGIAKLLNVASEHILGGSITSRARRLLHGRRATRAAHGAPAARRRRDRQRDPDHAGRAAAARPPGPGHERGQARPPCPKPSAATAPTAANSSTRSNCWPRPSTTTMTPSRPRRASNRAIAERYVQSAARLRVSCCAAPPTARRCFGSL